MRLAIPKEILQEEKRVAATPETVKKYVALGLEVFVESGAGEGIGRSDEEYRQAGAEIVQDTETLFSRAEVVLKVKQPIFNESRGKHEVDMMREGSLLITFLHPAAPDNHDMVRMLRDRHITSFTMDGIPRITRAQRMDALTSMSTVTGYKSILIAANEMPRFVPMMGTAIGTVPPARFLVVGAGVVGLQAIATAKRLGGVVQAVDIREEARKEAASLGAKVVGFEVPRDLAAGEGGYARALPEDWLQRERESLAQLITETDVLILSALVPGELAPVLVTQDMASSMKRGAVIVDVSIDQGGNCAITERGRMISRNGLHICGIQNIPGRLAEHASWLYGMNMYYYVENLFKKGLGTPDLDDDIVRHTLVTHEGRILYQGALKAMGEV
ncbi:MAG: NAD(P) transhydrogenase subunit alpha [Desulfatiglandales bacterium]